jgi:hypothetical protein
LLRDGFIFTVMDFLLHRRNSALVQVGGHYSVVILGPSLPIEIRLHYEAIENKRPRLMWAS